MTLLEIRTEIRGTLDDDIGATASQQIWSDVELNGYINEAEDVFCREIPLLIDSSTAQDADSIPLCQIATVAGTQNYAISDRIVEIRRVKIVGQANTLDKADVPLMDGIDSYWDDTAAANRKTPTRYLLDKETGKITLVRCPDAVYTVNMIVQRLPLAQMAANDDVPEINSRVHRLLFTYILHKAYMKRDVEAYSERKASDYMRLHLVDLEKARVETVRQTTSNRVVGIGRAYQSRNRGMISNGRIYYSQV